MPWKNNLGTTLEIDRIDTPADFLWRLSAAKISAPCSFSEFVGHDRLLTIWQGEGLLLNDFKLKPNQIFKFNGKEKIHCSPLDGDVIDVGLIYSPLKIRAQMHCLNLNDCASLQFSSDLNFLFCADGQFQSEDLIIDTGDTLRINNQKFCDILPLTESLKLIHIDIQIL